MGELKTSGFDGRTKKQDVDCGKNWWNNNAQFWKISSAEGGKYIIRNQRNGFKGYPLRCGGFLHRYNSIDAGTDGKEPARNLWTITHVGGGKYEIRSPSANKNGYLTTSGAMGRRGQSVDVGFPFKLKKRWWTFH